MDLVAVWPLHGLRLHTADLDLRPVTEADLPELCEILPPDVDLDPAATRYAALDDRANRRVVLAQAYWRHLGLWSTHDWHLPFAVRHRGELIGTQTVEGPDWTSERTVDSSSWLVPAVRGSGLGKQMRSAVLQLAFGHLGARAAISSAVVTNAGSLGVSRSLGYVDTHRSVLGHSLETLQHLRLEAAAWSSSGLGSAVRVEGVSPALPFFGLGEGA
jgi:RimJ/RimL family protein N-acetyltransferase